MPNVTPKVWKTCGYIRLSREDDDKEESNSIEDNRKASYDKMSSPEIIQRERKCANRGGGIMSDLQRGFKETKTLKQGIWRCFNSS